MKYLIGIDIGGTNIKIALVNEKGSVKNKDSFSTADCRTKTSLINAIAAHVKALISDSGITRKKIIGVGAGAPGAVDVRSGTVHYLTNIPDWREVKLGDILTKKLGIKAYVDNDVNVMALGELYFGAGRSARNMLCITLGTGVGGGLILDGRLYRGSNYAAGEFGHVPINEKGPKCNCGGRACVEAYVGNNYIIRDVTSRIKNGQRTLIKKLAGGDLSKITPKVISRAAARGDVFAKKVWIDAGGKVGIGLAGVVNLLNMEKIVIGGGVAEAGKILFDSIKRTIRARAMKLPARGVKVVKAKLGYDAGLIGAATLVLYESGNSKTRPI